MTIRSLIENDIVLPRSGAYSLIIGLNPSAGARSPVLWNQAYEALGSATRMLAIDVLPENINAVLQHLESDEAFVGGAVAAPYKETVFKRFSDQSSQEVKNIGAANILSRKNANVIEVHNTDGTAALHTFKSFIGDCCEKRILLVGYGGTGKAVSSYIISAYANNNEIFIANRSMDKFADVTPQHNVRFISMEQAGSLISNVDVVVNCTSAGDKNNLGELPFTEKSLGKLKCETAVFDVIYDPYITGFTKISLSKGCRVTNGVEMNFMQAVHGFMTVNANLYPDLNIADVIAAMR